MTPEPFYTSVRFWTSILTPVVALLAAYAAQHLPFLQVNQTQATEVFASLIVMGITFVIARTMRNTKVATSVISTKIAAKE